MQTWPGTQLPGLLPGGETRQRGLGSNGSSVSTSSPEQCCSVMAKKPHLPGDLGAEGKVSHAEVRLAIPCTPEHTAAFQHRMDTICQDTLMLQCPGLPFRFALMSTAKMSSFFFCNRQSSSTGKPPASNMHIGKNVENTNKHQQLPSKYFCREPHLHEQLIQSRLSKPD